MEFRLIKRAISAPVTLKVRARRTVKGWIKLLNWVARTMYATKIPITSARIRLLEDSLKACDPPEKTARYSSGRTSLVIFKTASSASCWECPGEGFANILIARSRFLRVIENKVGLTSEVTTSESGTTSPE